MEIQDDWRNKKITEEKIMEQLENKSNINKEPNRKEKKNIREWLKKKNIRVWLKIKNIREWLKIKNIRKWLKRNKIFFEIASSFCLTIMSIVTLGVSISFNRSSSKLYEKELEILENDREPYFTIKCEPISGKFEENGYSFTKKLYTVKNGGGLITGAYLLDVGTRAFIKIYDEKAGIQRTFTVNFVDLFEKTEGLISLYDEENKEFQFYRKETEKIDRVEEQLRKRLDKEYRATDKERGYRSSILLEDTITMEYVNYKNEEYHRVYRFFDEGKMILVKEFDPNATEFLGTLSIEGEVEGLVEEINRKIKEKCGYIANSGEMKLMGADLEKENIFSKSKRKIEALNMAKRYLSAFPYSRNGLMEQLESFEQYTHEEAVFAVDNCGTDWNEEAVKMAKNYSILESVTKKDLIEQLEKEGFTHEQAIYGVEANGY